MALVVLAELLGPAWPQPLAVARLAAGVAVAAAGLALLAAGALALGRALTPLPIPKEEASLNERGVYGLVRHPIYGGVILGVAGWSLTSTPLGLVMTAAVVAFLELKSRREESWLVVRFPGYEAYRRRVRWKFVPGLR